MHSFVTVHCACHKSVSYTHCHKRIRYITILQAPISHLGQRTLCGRESLHARACESLKIRDRCTTHVPLLLSIASIHCLYPLLISIASIHCFYPLLLSIASIHCFYPLLLSIASIHCFYPLLLSIASIHCFYPLLLSIASIHCFCSAGLGGVCHHGKGGTRVVQDEVVCRGISYMGYACH